MCYNMVYIKTQYIAVILLHIYGKFVYLQQSKDLT